MDVFFVHIFVSVEMNKILVYVKNIEWEFPEIIYENDMY